MNRPHPSSAVVDEADEDEDEADEGEDEANADEGMLKYSIKISCRLDSSRIEIDKTKKNRMRREIKTRMSRERMVSL